MMRVRRIDIANEVSPWCGGRFKSDGLHSGEMIRDDVLIPLLESNTYDKIIVDFRGCYGTPSSFLDEIFFKLFLSSKFNPGGELFNLITIYSDDQIQINHIMNDIKAKHYGGVRFISMNFVKG